MGLRTVLRNITFAAALSANAASGQSTAPGVGSVVNGASFAAGVSEGSLATIGGTNLADKSSIVNPECAITSPFPTSVCGVQVLVDGAPAPLLYVGPSQINFQVPYGAGTHQLAVRNNGRQSPNVALTVLDRSPGIFSYSAATPGGVFPNLAAAQLADYSDHAPANPVVMSSTPTLRSYLTLYLTGLGVPTNHPAPPLGSPAPIPATADDLLLVRPVDVLINGKPVPGANILYQGYGPGQIIHQVNILPPPGTPPGANTIRVCAGQSCSNDVTVFMTNTADYIVGSITNPGLMSDKKQRTLDTIAGAAKSDLGTSALAVNKDGNYLAPAKGNTTISLPGTPDWESYQDTIKANDATVVPTIPAFPHIVYPTTDVRGDYDRNTRTWTNTGYYDPLPGKWYGATTGGPVTLFSMVQYLATTGLNPACMEVVQMWERADAPHKIFLDPTGQPRFNPTTGFVCPDYCGGTTPDNATNGVDVLWKELSASPARGGPTFVRVNYDPVLAGEHGITFRFADDAEMHGYGGLTTIYPYSLNSHACAPITAASTKIMKATQSVTDVAAVGRHELLSRASGYGTSFSGIFSPFMIDNIGPASYVTDSARDLDGRKLVEFLGYGVDLGKYAK